MVKMANVTKYMFTTFWKKSKTHTYKNTNRQTHIHYSVRERKGESTQQLSSSKNSTFAHMV
jgi:hypothetical protein